MNEYDFLSLEDIFAIHALVLAEFGGADGILDQSVIESATAQPQARMFNQFLHEDITLMAAAYLFHLASQQGFRDGNKRTAVVATVEFLGRNGYRLTASNWEVYLVAMRIADKVTTGGMSKEEIANWILDRLEPIP